MAVGAHLAAVMGVAPELTAVAEIHDAVRPEKHVERSSARSTFALKFPFSLGYVRPASVPRGAAF